MHKYNTDGTLASSWHAWWENGERQLPIQEDETGLPLWALWHHFDKFHDVEFIRPLFRTMIRPAAEFMESYVDANGLPQPSYDLWEERRGVHAWSVAATWAGLMAAARFFTAFGETADAERVAEAARRMKSAAEQHLWRAGEGRFLRSIMAARDGQGYDADLTVDASVCGLFLFGMFDASDERVTSTVKHLRETLWVPTAVGGMARYERDAYQRASRDASGPWQSVVHLHALAGAMAHRRGERNWRPGAGAGVAALGGRAGATERSIGGAGRPGSRYAALRLAAHVEPCRRDPDRGGLCGDVVALQRLPHLRPADAAPRPRDVPIGASLHHRRAGLKSARSLKAIRALWYHNGSCK